MAIASKVPKRQSRWIEGEESLAWRQRLAVLIQSFPHSITGGVHSPACTGDWPARVPPPPSTLNIHLTLATSTRYAPSAHPIKRARTRPTVIARYRRLIRRLRPGHGLPSRPKVVELRCQCPLMRGVRGCPVSRPTAVRKSCYVPIPVCQLSEIASLSLAREGSMNRTDEMKDQRTKGSILHCGKQVYS